MQDLEQSHRHGQQKLDNIFDKSNTVLPQTSQPGQQVIHNQVAQSQQALSSLLDKTVQSREYVETILEAWDRFDDAKKELADWMKGAEENVKKLKELQPHLMGKKAQLANVKVIFQHVSRGYVFVI